MVVKLSAADSNRMNVAINQMDSEVFDGCVLDLADFDPTADFAAFEAGYLARHSPIYISCKVPVEDLESVHQLEAAGFRFVEFQMRFRASLGRSFDVSAHDYRYELVTSPEILERVLEIAGATFEHDRITRDPYIKQLNRPDLSGERYRRFVSQSFQRPDECVYALISNPTDQVVGFGTHRITGPDSALLLISGVAPELKSSGLGALLDQFAWNELKRKGIKYFFGHASGANYPIINLVMRGMGFRFVQGFVVLRKVYGYER
jgi:ribosomal protein S18 acetylase RimI-like enzyme